MTEVIIRNDTRELILEAADALLAHYGYQKTTMEDIAQKAGLSRRTLYLHFQNKEEVALATIDRIIERLVGELEKVAAVPAPAARRVSEMLVTRVLFMFDASVERYHAYDEMMRELRPRYMLRREEYMQSEALVFARVLEDGMREGEFQVQEPYETAQLLILATNALLPFSLSPRQLGSRAEIEHRICRLAELLGNGLRVPAGSRPGTGPEMD